MTAGQHAMYRFFLKIGDLPVRRSGGLAPPTPKKPCTAAIRPVSCPRAWGWPWAWAETRIAYAETRIAWNDEALHRPVPYVRAETTSNQAIAPHLKVGVGWTGWSAALHGHITQFRFGLLLALCYLYHETLALGPSCTLQLMAFLAKSWF